MYNILFFLVGVALTSSGVEADCRPVTLLNLNDLQCLNALPYVERDLFLTDPFSKNGSIPWFYKCSLEKIGFLSGGTFNKAKMKEVAEAHLDSRDSAKKLYKRYKKSAKAVRKIGNDCEKARKFSQLNHEDEIKHPLLVGQICSET